MLGHAGARRWIRTITERILSPLPLPVGLHARIWWVPRDLNSDDLKGPAILQTAAAMPYLPDTRTLAEAERLERSRPVPHWTGGLANRCHTVRRRFRTGTRATIRTPCDGFGSHLLSQEHPSINWRRVKESNPRGSSPWRCFQDSFPTIRGHSP